MKFHELSTRSSKNSKRVGRGIAAGRGKTAGRGTKGQSSRAGGRVRPGFEGGQNPLYMRLPKLPGFRSNRPKAELLYTGQLDKLGSQTVNNESLATAGLVTSPYTRVKLVVKGEVTKKMTIQVQAVSKAAVEMIEKAGGKVTITPQLGRSKTSKTDTSS